MAKIFRRYKSTIYGNYRKAYLTDGLLTGIAMSLVLLLRDCMGDIPMRQPENFVTELVLAIGIFLFGYLYRKELPRGKVTFKELMLLGLGIGVVSAIAFGLWVWLYCGVIDTNMVFYYNRQRVCMMEPAECRSQGCQRAGDEIYRWRLGVHSRFPLGSHEHHHSFLCRFDIQNGEESGGGEEGKGKIGA